MFHTWTLGFSGRGFIGDREMTMRGTGEKLYGSVLAVFPPIRMASKLRRRSRKTVRSALEVTPREEPNFVVEPSAPTTSEAEVLMAIAFQYWRYFSVHHRHLS